MSAKKIVGQKYRVIRPNYASDEFYSEGDIVTLVHDTGNLFDIPFFTGNSGSDTRADKPRGFEHVRGCYICMDKLELIAESIEEKIARLEEELQAAKNEKNEVSPWAQYKEGDKILIQAIVTVVDVESAEYSGDMVLKVAFENGDQQWINKELTTNSKKLN